MHDEEGLSDSELEDLIGEEAMNSVVDIDDADQFGEKLMEAQWEAKVFLLRFRRQYGGETWVTAEFQAMLNGLDAMYDRMQQLVDHGLFPDLAEIRRQQGGGG